ncbi:uncharacterized protein PAC_01720 [Phialocephala subalpina]|uniref:RNAse P Rpr2/Rpp21 subunit domain protein n=1 Tax=Phialocephala subalpina TaxID=576137 RepID=A0A1L7WGH3_9HELO|nr:uncharacterized protein PAC_01720 [Phialocephala subalpina]
MGSPELSARLRYLNDSAHLLAATAPETSRHLMSRCNALKFDNQIDQSDAQQRPACGSCGSLMLAGWEGTLESHSERSRASKAGKSLRRPVQSRVIAYECGTCGRKTRERAKAPPAVKRHTVAASIYKSADQLGTSASPSTNTPSTNSSSKKRAKTRKGGLAAILAQKNTASTSGSRFDLMDFMKKA